jgi:Raf kinase inhibitor-like YbhB/YbcL family protein
MRNLLTLALSLALLAPVCDKNKDPQPNSSNAVEASQIAGVVSKNMQLSSPSFASGAKIPEVHSCDSTNISPQLEWKNVPPNAQSLALIVADPDAPSGNFVHWIAWNIDPKSSGLPQDVKPAATNLSQGMNHMNKVGYTGPCPPTGSHRYYFKLYALDTKLNLSASTTDASLKQAMNGHILAEAELMGRYQRK